MSKLSVDQKTIKALLEDKKSDFIIPDYQRPYAWEEKECQQLWDDIFAFAIPDDNAEKFDRNEEYFLGPIVTFINSGRKMEIIDGQQRLTTIMLLLRAFYARFGSMQDENAKITRESIEKCIWKTDELGRPNMNELKIDSEVATDDNKEEFLDILKTGIVKKEYKSKYAENYRFFVRKINDFVECYPSYFQYLPIRILNNCILLPIEAESQETALRIFSTLNDRGMPLSDADLFKAQFYNYYNQQGKEVKEKFIERWRNLETICEKIFHPISGTPMDELFTRYMYFERAKQGIKSSTTEALRKFYEKNKYELLRNENTLNNLEMLADFWESIDNQDDERFSDAILRKLFILNYAQNGMWTYFTSVYFMQNKDADGLLINEKFNAFLSKMIPFIWAYALTNPGVNALRTPIYAEMINIVENKEVTFDDFKFDEQSIRNLFSMYNFSNGRPITKAMLVWWAYENNNQQLLELSELIEIEHIYARNRQDKGQTLIDKENIEALGNKSILEKRINIRASDYRFEDKKKYYSGFEDGKKKWKAGTKIYELIELTKNEDFGEKDIEARTKNMVNKFIDYLAKENLLK